MNKTTKRVKTSLIHQSEVIEDEIKEIDLQIDQLREKKSALSQALLMAENDEREDVSPKSSTKMKEMETEEDAEERALNSLMWKPFRSGKTGEWTFATDRGGNLMTELARSRSLVTALREQRRVSLGGYHYKMSQDGKFLHRFPASNGA